MPSEEDIPEGHWSTELTRHLVYIIGSFAILGATWAAADGSLNLAMRWLQIGIGISILYVLYEIAHDIHEIREIF